MKKILVFLLVSVLLLSGLAGCNSKPGDLSENPKENALTLENAMDFLQKASKNTATADKLSAKLSASVSMAAQGVSNTTQIDGSLQIALDQAGALDKFAVQLGEGESAYSVLFIDSLLYIDYAGLKFTVDPETFSDTEEIPDVDLPEDFDPYALITILSAEQKEDKTYEIKITLNNEAFIDAIVASLPEEDRSEAKKELKKIKDSFSIEFLVLISEEEKISSEKITISVDMTKLPIDGLLEGIDLSGKVDVSVTLSDFSDSVKIQKPADADEYLPYEDMSSIGPEEAFLAELEQELTVTVKENITFDHGLLESLEYSGSFFETEDIYACNHTAILSAEGGDKYTLACETTDGESYIDSIDGRALSEEELYYYYGVYSGYGYAITLLYCADSLDALGDDGSFTAVYGEDALYIISDAMMYLYPIEDPEEDLIVKSGSAEYNASTKEISGTITGEMIYEEETYQFTYEFSVTLETDPDPTFTVA